jgi:mannose-6-phosphate isomerase-like protein (cupin superfamily)
MNMALENKNFRTAVWTGEYLQMTLMCIPPCGDIGGEVHRKTDQIIRIEQGKAKVIMGTEQCPRKYVQELCKGDVVFVSAGTRHNVINIDNSPLKISSIYAPPQHPRGTVHETKGVAMKEEAD